MIYLAAYPATDRLENRRAERELGRKLLGYGLELEYGIRFDPEQVKLGTGKWGKPYLEELPGIFFNISHSEGIAACGIGDRELGVDIERLRPFSMKTARRFLTDRECEELESGGESEKAVRFFRFWTLKESFVKAIGRGLSFPFRDVEFSLEKPGNIWCSRPGYRFYQRRIGREFVAAVCVRDTIKGGCSSMTYEEVFNKVKEIFGKADVSNVKDHLAFQFNLTGNPEGAFYAEISEGELHVEPYEYYDRDVLFTCTADTLLGIASGKTDPVMAFTLGRLKVQGNLETALRIQEFVRA